jgi:class 3 adenylate cyclase
VADLAGSSEGFSFEPIPPATLKGFHEPVPLFRLAKAS